MPQVEIISCGALDGPIAREVLCVYIQDEGDLFSNDCLVGRTVTAVCAALAPFLLFRGFTSHVLVILRSSSDKCRVDVQLCGRIGMVPMDALVLKKAMGVRCVGLRLQSGLPLSLQPHDDDGVCLL